MCFIYLAVVWVLNWAREENVSATEKMCYYVLIKDQCFQSGPLFISLLQQKEAEYEQQQEEHTRKTRLSNVQNLITFLSVFLKLYRI